MKIIRTKKISLIISTVITVITILSTLQSCNNSEEYMEQSSIKQYAENNGLAVSNNSENLTQVNSESEAKKLINESLKFKGTTQTIGNTQSKTLNLAYQQFVINTSNKTLNKRFKASPSEGSGGYNDGNNNDNTMTGSGSTNGYDHTNQNTFKNPGVWPNVTVTVRYNTDSNGNITNWSISAIGHGQYGTLQLDESSLRVNTSNGSLSFSVEATMSWSMGIGDLKVGDDTNERYSGTVNPDGGVCTQTTMP